MATASFLRAVPVLSELSVELLERQSGQMREVHVRAGEWIMHKGDQADAMFIIERPLARRFHTHRARCLVEIGTFCACSASRTASQPACSTSTGC